MQKDLQDKLRQLRIRNSQFLMVVDFAGTLYALGPDKDHIKDPFLPEDDEFLSGKRAIKGAIELDPVGCQNTELKPFQKDVDKYAWTVIPSVAQLLHDVNGINVTASSVADDPEQVSLQKQANKENHIHIHHILRKKYKRVIRKGYHPSTIVVLGDTSSDIDLAVEIAKHIEKSSSNAKVICGFTPSGMQTHEKVQNAVQRVVESYPEDRVVCGLTQQTIKKQETDKNETEQKEHLPKNIKFIIDENWSKVVHQLRKILPIKIKSQHLHQFNKLRKQRNQAGKQNFYHLPRRER